MTELLSDEIRQLIGHVGPVVVSPSPYTEERHRRFVHAMMEEQPVHLDRAAAAGSKFGDLVAPPLWPMHAFVRGLDEPDPLDPLLSDLDWDGIGDRSRTGLPPIPSPLMRFLNGGTEAEFRQLVKLGDVVRAQSRYLDIEGRQGQSGPLLLVRVETTYTNQDADVLAVVTMTIIRR